MTEIKIIDNFLLELEYNHLISSVVKNQYFPWWYSPVTTEEYGVFNQCSEFENYQFTHVLYYDKYA